MNLIDLEESNLVVNPLAIAYIDCNESDGASDGGCKLHLLTGDTLVVTGDEANQIIGDNDHQNYSTQIAEEIELFRKSFMDSQK